MNKRLKVVVADDIEMMVKQTVEILNKNENIAQIEIAKNGKELLEKIEKYNPDIVYTDFRMPELTGIEVIERIREKNAEKQTIFILITAERGIEIIQKSKQLGFYIEYKPITEEKILKYINNIEDYEINYNVDVKEKATSQNKVKKENIWKRIFKKN